MEGLMAGLPAVVTNCRGNRDIIQNEKNGFIVENMKQLIEKILQTKGNYEELYNMNKNHTEMEKFSLENVMKEMGSIYTKG